MATVRVVVDKQAAYELEKNHQVMGIAKKEGEALSQSAGQILHDQVKHTDPPTIPIMAESFYVTEVDHEVIVSNHDPDYVLIEVGTHPGGGETEIKYAPLRKALDQKENGAND